MITVHNEKIDLVGSDNPLRALERTDPEAFRTALAIATVTASFTVEDFGVRRLLDLRKDEVDGRLRRYASMLRIGAD